jgi:hypothetical protein
MHKSVPRSRPDNEFNGQELKNEETTRDFTKEIIFRKWSS